MAGQKRLGAATQMGLRQAQTNKKNLKKSVPEVAPMIDLGGDKVDIGFNSNEMEDPMLMRHLKGVPKQPSVQDIIEEIGDNFEYIELLANATPYGMMVPYSLPTEPIDWVFCNGQACPESPLRDQLIEAGNPFGTVGGVPAVPNLSGRTIVGNTSMGNVQQPALPNATALNTTLGTTNGLFTIVADQAPQRPHNIGTGPDGLLTLTIDNALTGITQANGNNANITNNTATTGITLAGATPNITVSQVNASNHNHTGSGGGTNPSGHSHLHYMTRVGTVGEENNVAMYQIANTFPPNNSGPNPPEGGWGTRLARFAYPPDNIFRYGTSRGGTFQPNNENPTDDATHKHSFTTTSNGGHGHSVSAAQDAHNHTITDNGHTHGITQTNHTHTITDPQHKHDASIVGEIEGHDFEFDLTQPGLVVNFIIFHGQHLPEDTEPVVRHNELAPIVEELEAATKANADLIEQNMAMMKQLEAKING